MNLLNFAKYCSINVILDAELGCNDFILLSYAKNSAKPFYKSYPIFLYY